MFPGLWKVSVVCPVYKNVGEHLTPLKYYSISLSLLILSSTRLSIMLTETTFWVTKSIVFNPLGSLLMSWLSFSETLDNKFILREVVLDISKVFDKVWQRWLLHKLTSYGISRRDFLIIKSFLLGRFMKFLINGWSCFLDQCRCPQGFIFSPTLILLYISNLLKILRLRINIYADDDTMIYVSLTLLAQFNGGPTGL